MVDYDKKLFSSWKNWYAYYSWLQISFYKLRCQQKKFRRPLPLNKSAAFKEWSEQKHIYSFLFNFKPIKFIYSSMFMGFFPIRPSFTFNNY